MKKTICAVLCAAVVTATAVISPVSAVFAAESETAVSVNQTAGGDEYDQKDFYGSDWAERYDQVVSVKNAAIYSKGDLANKDVLTVAEVKGFEDVPFVSIRQYLDFMNKNLCETGSAADTQTVIKDMDYTLDSDNGIFRITRNGVTMELQLEPMELRSDNWGTFFNAAEPGAHPYGVLADQQSMNYDPITFSEKTEWVSTSPEKRSMDLAYDGFGYVMLNEEEDVLLPFSLLQDTFGKGASFEQYLYNGDDFYDVVSKSEDFIGKDYAILSENMTPYVSAFFSGSFADKEEMTPSYAKFTYALTCMVLDHYYGHKDEKGITDFDTYLTEQGLKEDLISTDPAKSAKAVKTLFNRLFDTGHEGVLISNSLFGLNAKKKSLEDGGIFAKISSVISPLADTFLTMGTEQTGQILDSGIMELLRPEKYKDGPRVDFEGDTAILYFPSFASNLERESSFYEAPPTEEDYSTSTYAFFYDAFRQIKEHPEIKNVVIDLSDNGGGMSSALTCTLGFLSKDGDVTVSFQDERDKGYHEEYYHIDTNLDGVADDQDGYGDQYDFYIFTGPSSYSCGTALPYYAQQQGLAKIIGAQPGGGDCCVNYLASPNGVFGSFSGEFKLGSITEDGFVSDEKTVIPDIVPEGDVTDLYFNPAAIAELIHTAA